MTGSPTICKLWIVLFFAALGTPRPLLAEPPNHDLRWVRAKDLVHSAYSAESGISALAFSTDEKCLVTCGREKRVHLWNIEEGKRLQSFQCESVPMAVALSPDGSHLAIGCWDGAEVWDLKLGKRKFQLAGKGSANVRFSPDGRVLAFSVGSHGVYAEIRLWQLDKYSRICTSQRYRAPVASMAFSPDSKRLVTGGWDRSVRVLSAVDCGGDTEIHRFSHQAHAIALSCNGEWLAAGSGAGDVIVTGMNSGKRSVALKHGIGIKGLSFTSDDEHLITVGTEIVPRSETADQPPEARTYKFVVTVRAWKTESGEPALPALTLTDNHVLSTAVSKGGLVAVGTLEGRVHLCRLVSKGGDRDSPIQEHRSQSCGK